MSPMKGKRFKIGDPKARVYADDLEIVLKKDISRQGDEHQHDRLKSDLLFTFILYPPPKVASPVIPQRRRGSLPSKPILTVYVTLP